MQTITENELTEWFVFYRQEPFGDVRADIRNAQLCSLLANINRDSKKKSTPYNIDDFMLFQEPSQPRKQTPEQALSILMAVARRQNNVHSGR